MDTEKRSHNPRSAAVSAADQPQRPRNRACPRWIPRRPLRPTRCGWCSAHTAALRGNARGARGFCRCSGRQPTPRKIVAAVLFFVPEGPRRKLAGGKRAQRARPPVGPPNGPCPSRGIEEGFRRGCSEAAPSLLVGAGRSNRRRSTSSHSFFFDAPLGHRTTRDEFRGRRPLARTCPRLISSGVPPGLPTRGDAVRQEPGDAEVAFQTRSVAASPRGVHRVSVVFFGLSTAP